MNCWTPAQGDVVRYATVREARSSSSDDVGSYLCDLKKDLKIGCEGYPSYVVLGGDQQIYAILKNLKAKHPAEFAWIFPVPGDWHLVKTMSEVIKNLLWEGGFHEIAVKCGLKGEVTKWQDIHRILVPILEGLLRTFLKQVQENDPEAFVLITSDWRAFQRYLDDGLSAGVCRNEVSQFWCRMIYYFILLYLMIYFGCYFSIRSGNWFLRNACIKQAAE